MYSETPASYGRNSHLTGHVPDSLIEDLALGALPRGNIAVYVNVHLSCCDECYGKLDEAKALLSFFRHAGRSRLMTVTIAAGVGLAENVKKTRRPTLRQQIVVAGGVRMGVKR